MIIPFLTCLSLLVERSIKSVVLFVSYLHLNKDDKEYLPGGFHFQIFNNC